MAVIRAQHKTSEAVVAACTGADLLAATDAIALWPAHCDPQQRRVLDAVLSGASGIALPLRRKS